MWLLPAQAELDALVSELAADRAYLESHYSLAEHEGEQEEQEEHKELDSFDNENRAEDETESLAGSHRMSALQAVAEEGRRVLAHSSSSLASFRVKRMSGTGGGTPP